MVSENIDLSGIQCKISLNNFFKIKDQFKNNLGEVNILAKFRRKIIGSTN